jgi:GntR family transcriptional regulator/MocR family aminotransferase
MPKRTATFELTLPPRDPNSPAVLWLSSALRTEILEGRLRPGSRLPATRDLARQYSLSRGTIVSAFDQLKAEGYVDGSVGSGTYVSETLPDELLQVSRGAAPRNSEGRAARRRLSAYARAARLYPAFPTRAARAFRFGQPALDLFPTTRWAQLASRRLRGATTGMLLGCDAMGYRPLRAAVADYLTTFRGVRCTPAQIAIVSGVQEALDLVTRVVLDRGDRVCLEDPGYLGAALAFEAAGAKIVSVGVDREGMEVPSARARGARLAYVTPGHQFPLGVSMSLPRRLALLEWARTSNAFIFEDDYDSEYRYSGRPLPSLQGLDRHGLVLFAGSFSKVMFPALRLGYLVIPPDLVEYFEATKSLGTRHAPLLDQAVLCDFIVDGHFGRHIRRMREVYANRLLTLVACAKEELAGALEISAVEAGLQSVGWLGDGMASRAVAKAAAERGVEASPVSRYSRVLATREGLQLGFAAVDEREIRRGVHELSRVLAAMRRASQ